MHEFIRHFRIHFGTFFVITFILLITRNGILLAYGALPHELNFLPEKYYLAYYVGFITLSAFFSSLVLTGIDLTVIHRFIHKKSFLFVLLITLLADSLILGVVFVLMDFSMHYFLDLISGQSSAYYNPGEIIIAVFHVLLVLIISRTLIEIDRKLGPGNLWKFLTGRLYKPREEQRLFMFIDLQGSTVIAEQLGHLKYSELISDCFHDLSIVDRYRAEVYQYVGDEVVLTWPLNKRESYLRCLDAFFAFQNSLRAKADYYQANYGLLPVFKAGVHLGPTVMTQVGDIKREICYHGDTLNTAARIEGKCNEFEARLLISESLYHTLSSSQTYTFQDVGCIACEGNNKKSDYTKSVHRKRTIFSKGYNLMNHAMQNREENPQPFEDQNWI